MTVADDVDRLEGLPFQEIELNVGNRIGFVDSGCGCDDPLCDSFLYGFVLVVQHPIEKEHKGFLPLLWCPLANDLDYGEISEERSLAFEACVNRMKEYAKKQKTRVVMKD